MRLCWLLLIGIVGCGEEEDEFGTSGGSEFEAEGDYSCCINGAYYECSSSDAVLDCLDGDTSGCSSAGDC